MNSTDLIEKRIAITCRRHPALPRVTVLLLRMIRQIASHITCHANAILRTWDISYAEYIVLMSLYGTENYTLNASALRDVTGEDAAHLSRLTEQLCSKAWVTRGLQARDKRKATFTLTPEGLELIDAFLPVVSALLDRWSEVFAQVEFQELERLLRKILEECEA